MRIDERAAALRRILEVWRRLREAERRACAAGLLLVGVVALTLTTCTPATPAPPDISGAIVLHRFINHWGDECSGDLQYNDIEAGADVIVRDGAGDIIAVGDLGAGEFTPGEVLHSWGECRFPFTVEAVPHSPVYQFAVGWRDRGALVVSRDELERQGWWVGMSLGNR